MNSQIKLLLLLFFPLLLDLKGLRLHDSIAAFSSERLSWTSLFCCCCCFFVIALSLLLSTTCLMLVVLTIVFFFFACLVCYFEAKHSINQRVWALAFQRHVVVVFFFFLFLSSSCIARSETCYDWIKPFSIFPLWYLSVSFFFLILRSLFFFFFFFILLLLCVMRRVLTISVYKTLESTFLLFFYQRFIAHLCYTRRCCITIKQVLLTHICVFFFLSIASVAAQGPCYTSAFSFSSFFVVCVSVLNAFFFFFFLNVHNTHCVQLQDISRKCSCVCCGI